MQSCRFFGNSSLALTARGPGFGAFEAAKKWDVFELHTYPPYTKAHHQKLLAFLTDYLQMPITPHAISDFVRHWKHPASEGDEQLGYSFHRTIRLFAEDRERAIARKFLDESLNNGVAADMPLVDRDAFVAPIRSFVNSAVSTSFPKMLLTLQSTSASGKTQLLKHCLFWEARRAICGHCVMVVDCAVAGGRFRPSIDALLKASHQRPLQKDDVCAFVVSLIRAHIKAHVPHAALPDTVADDVDAACRAWKAATESDVTEKFEVFIVFDNIDRLPLTTGIMNFNDSPPKCMSLAEAIACVLPSEVSVLATGAQQIRASDIFDPSTLILPQLPAPLLAALSYRGYLVALEKSWRLHPAADSTDVEEGPQPNKTTRVLHYICGGVPKLLSIASRSVMGPIHPLVLLETWGVIIASVVDAAADSMAGEMPTDGDAHLVMWAVGALASATKTRVDIAKPMPLLGSDVTWGDATKGLLYAQPSAEEETNSVPRTAMVLGLPPALMLNDAVKSMFCRLRDQQAEGPSAAMPLALRTWPNGLDVAFLHLAPSTIDEVIKSSFFPHSLQYAELYERLVANAIVARWYLLWLLGGGAQEGKRIPLNTVLCADIPLLEGVFVDFSGGLLVDSDQHLPMRPTDEGFTADGHGCVVQLCGDVSGGEVAGHHVLRFAATKSNAEGDVGVTHIVVSVSCQVWSENAKEAAAHPESQCTTTDEETDEECSPADVLLLVSPAESTVNHPRPLGVHHAHIPSDPFCSHESIFAYY